MLFVGMETWTFSSLTRRYTSGIKALFLTLRSNGSRQISLSISLHCLRVNTAGHALTRGHKQAARHASETHNSSERLPLTHFPTDSLCVPITHTHMGESHSPRHVSVPIHGN
jgi:hypothetical protein